MGKMKKNGKRNSTKNDFKQIKREITARKRGFSRVEPDMTSEISPAA